MNENSKSTDHKDHGGTKFCRVCDETIKARAKKCIHCDSWQDWRGDINFSTEVLSLLVALAAVLGALIPAAVGALTPKESVFAATFQAETERYISVLVSNLGGRAGSITVARLVIDNSKNVDVWQAHLRVVTSDGTGAILISPQSNVLVRFEKDLNPKHFEKGNLTEIGPDKIDGTDDTDMQQIRRYRCKLTYGFTNFDGSNEAKSESFACERLYLFLDTLFHPTVRKK